MQSTCRERDYRDLLREIGEPGYAGLLAVVSASEPLFRQFVAWPDFIGFMQSKAAPAAGKQRALLAILRANGRDGDPRWRSILLAAFWPGLDSVFKRKHHWDVHADERWQNIQWAFLQTVCNLDIVRREDRIASRIINGTIHRLHDEYRRLWRQVERETPTDPEMFEDLLGSDGIDCDAIDLQIAQEKEIQRIRNHARAGRISEADCLLIIGTRIYGKSAAEYGREIGISGDLARKRRLRAEASIRRAEGRAGNSLSRCGHLEGPFTF